MFADKADLPSAPAHHCPLLVSGENLQSQSVPDGHELQKGSNGKVRNGPSSVVGWPDSTPHPTRAQPWKPRREPGACAGPLEVCGHENAVDEGKTLPSVELGGPVEELRPVLMAGKKRGEESPSLGSRALEARRAGRGARGLERRRAESLARTQAPGTYSRTSGAQRGGGPSFYHGRAGQQRLLHRPAGLNARNGGRVLGREPAGPMQEGCGGPGGAALSQDGGRRVDVPITGPVTGECRHRLGWGWSGQPGRGCWLCLSVARPVAHRSCGSQGTATFVGKISTCSISLFPI